MVSKSSVLWSLKELSEELNYRRSNEFDANFVVTGARGNGKSSFIFKLLSRFGKEFKPWKHITYSRDDIIDLLKTQVKGICWDDEAINSGYKRDFQSKGQQELIKLVTAYRDNFNIYASAVPSFYSLDKDLRELIFLHIHIIERGFGAIFMPIGDTIFSKDKWDSANNEKMESTWQKKKQKNPLYEFPYHKLSTFVGYIYFGKLSPKQEKLYKEIKRKKREEAFLTENEKSKNKELGFYDKVYDKLIKRKLTKEGFIQLCIFEDKKYTTASNTLNHMLRNNNEVGTMKDYLVKTIAERRLELKMKKLGRSKPKTEVDEFFEE